MQGLNVIADFDSSLGGFAGASYGGPHIFSRKGRQIRVSVFELPDPRDGGCMLAFGDIGCHPLVRIHSRCLYGDALGSDDCDCGQELERSMDLIQAEGAGVLVYLEQEGRGAGLAWKARGYRVGEMFGIDTFDSYRRLGLRVDSRHYDVAARAVRALGLTRVRLLTNNPDKCRALAEAGIEVDPVPLTITLASPRGKRYLQAKRVHRHHTIPVDDQVDNGRRRTWWWPGRRR
ncbi:GTP cyclohydrolase II [Nocardia caishijiensis]|uniref:GTP cyclohydrolase II n=1 Tax=Nocardia caishijiensis TaxID=184756 RepID=A0ABQ6YNK5_9NOCA|nr:GTP cyclohydrolase II [Nocardia caishijiensis]KAF0847021.1 3,4-dihydroxy 2-butanone 4-phosphate synthase/GTP cyclohydrolase II [Nocardia caishijiensis]